MPDIYMDVDTALSEVPVNLMPLVDDTDFKSIEADVNYNATGLSLIWHFTTTAGAYSQTAVTPTDTGGNYDWVEQGNGMFTIEIPASGGATINNDTEGFGWFTGVATGILPWRGPVIGFRKASMNNIMIDNGTLQDNLEDMFDGTGYVGGTIVQRADLAAMGGTAQSATDLKDFADTGYDPSTHKVAGVVLTDLATAATSVTNIVTANVTQLGGVAQSLTDLKDFADTGYDPVTHKVAGVVLTDLATATTSVTNMVTANVTQISGDSTAADNLELFMDGTGYAGGTIKLGVDVVAISGDTTAADNCELDYDGTGYAGGTIVKTADVTKIGGVAQSLTDLKDFADTGYDPATHKVQGVVLTDLATASTSVTNTVAANVIQIGGVVQSLTDFKDFVDTGYDPSTHKVAGVVLVDTTTTTTTATNVTTVNGLANDVITAASIANGAIDNATFAADVGSTAGATNIIALAVDKSLELAKIPKSDSNVTWNATALASINAEVVDVLHVDTHAELAQGAPPATDSLAHKIGYLYKFMRNKIETTATQISVYNDAGDTVDHKSTISDDSTTFSRGEFATGP
jgi:hypothetical protein